MKYVKCWEARDVDTYFTTESREKNREVFEKTHVPIQKIQVNFSQDLPATKSFITEEEFRNLVVNSSPEEYNRIFLIVGETGCGKSELCQWLEYNIRDGVHIPIHISRSDTKIEHIFSILNQHLPEEVQDTSKPGELIGVKPHHLAGLLVAKLTTEFDVDRTIKNTRDRQILEKLFEDEMFERKLAKDIEDYQERVKSIDKERQLLIMQKKTFEFHPITKSLSDTIKPYTFVTRVINQTLKEYLKVSDVGNILRQISENYLKIGKRPVLLLEDLTSFTFLAEDLIDYLFDLGKGHFDVVIGWTTGFESGNRDLIFKAPDSLTYMKERLRARLLLTDEKDRSTFFLTDSYKELAKKYLSAVKCGKCKTCTTDTEGLYPFNSACLARIHSNLQEDNLPKQTPRVFLEFVIRKVLKETELPARILSSSLYLKQVPSLMPLTYNDFPDFVELAKWYGEEGKENVEIDRQITEWFGIKSPIKGNEKKYVVPMSPSAIAMRKSKIKTEPEVQKGLEEAITDFQLWLQNGGKFLNRDYLRKGAIEALELAGDPCEIKSSRSTIPKAISLFYQRGSDNIPVFIEDSGDDSSDADYKLTVTRRSPPEILEQLFYLGSTDGHIPESKLVSVFEWANEQTSSFNKKLVSNLSTVLGVSLEQFLIFSKFLLINLLNGSAKLDANEFKTDVGKNADPVPTFLVSNLDAKALTLFQKKDEIQALFSSFFSVTSSFFDYAHFQEIISTMDVRMMLKKIENIDTSKIRDGYKVGNRKDYRPFKDLVGTISSYTLALDHFQYIEHFEEMRQRSTAIVNLIPVDYSPADLTPSIEKIKTACSRLDIALEPSWTQGFQIVDGQELDFQSFNDEISDMLRRFAECEDIFQFVQFKHEYDNCSKRAEWVLLTTLAGLADLVKLKSKNRPAESADKTSISSETKKVEVAYEELERLTDEFT